MTRLALVLILVAARTAGADEIRDVPGEVIVVEGRAPPVTAPKPTNYVKQKAPPYSDRAILSDAWTKAWLLLEIDERGTVTRV